MGSKEKEKQVTVSVTLEIVLTQEDIDDIMCGALEGGITYWCDEAKVVGDYLGEYGSEQIARGGKLRLLEVRTEWAVYKDCFLQVARYQADNSRAIEIWNNEDGPIARITVCIAGSGLAEDETVIDTNNCPWAMEFIKQHGFGQATGRMVKSGYCTYPVVKLDIEKIGEYLEVA